MLKWLGYLLLAAIIVAAVTAPSRTKFEKFIEKNAGTASCKPIVTHLNYKVFSICKVRRCKELRQLRRLQTGEPVNTSVAIPVFENEEKYLGLFGRFWKL